MRISDEIKAEFLKEYGRNKHTVYEPDIFYEVNPYLRAIWLSPVYQRRLDQRLNDVMWADSTKIIRFYLGVINLSVLVFTTIFSNIPNFVVAFLILTFIVNVYFNLFVSIFFRLPRRIKQLFNLDRHDPVLLLDSGR